MLTALGAVWPRLNPLGQSIREHIHIWATICLPRRRHHAARRGDSNTESPGHFSECHSDWMRAAKWSARWSKLKGWTDRRIMEQAAKKAPLDARRGSPHVWDPEGWRLSDLGNLDEAGAHQERRLRWWPAEGRRRTPPTWWWGEGREREGNMIEGQAPNQHVPRTDSGCDWHQERMIMATKGWTGRENRKTTVHHKEPRSRRCRDAPQTVMDYLH